MLFFVQWHDQCAQTVSNAENRDDRQRLAGGNQTAWNQMACDKNKRREHQHQRDRFQRMRQQGVSRFIHQRQTRESQNVHGKSGNQNVCVSAVVDNDFSFPE